MNEQKKAPLTTVDGNTLMAQTFPPLQFSVDKILPHGLFILAGSGKIGKSWLALDICKAVATGGALWDFSAGQGEVLYFALEDSYARLQSRLKIMEAEKLDISKFHMTTASLGIGNGLLEQTHNFLADHPGTRLLVIDTLERVRNLNYDKNMYSCDYRDMTNLRRITDKYQLTLLLVHHTRKMYDPDPLNTLSGSTGLVGAVDGVFVLEKESRTGSKAKLTIANRDTESFCFKLEFDSEKCRWIFLENDSGAADDEEPLCTLIDDFLINDWRGTATELCGEVKKLNPGLDCTPVTITKKLKTLTGLFKKKYGVVVEVGRNRDGRIISLYREENATDE